MAKCENCGKRRMIGHNVSHAKNRTKRVFKANLHKARVFVNGGWRRMILCTKCLRKLKKESAATSKKISNRSSNL